MRNSVLWMSLALLSLAPLQSKPSHTREGAWFIGPLLTPSGHVVPEGHQNYEPYVYLTETSKMYNGEGKRVPAPKDQQLLTQASMQRGIFPGIDIDVTLQGLYHAREGLHAWRIGDVPLAMGLQIMPGISNSLQPAMKLHVGMNIPLGKYDHLNPLTYLTDGGGSGDFSPEIGVVFSNIHTLSNGHHLAWRTFFSYTASTSVSVKGLSVYGGSIETVGKVRPGSSFLTSGSLEYQLTQQVALACDVMYTYTNKTTFSGFSPPNTAPTSPSSALLVMAPAIEYSVSPNVGMILGSSLPLAGRNTSAPINSIFAINFYH
ncbi:MAG: transporter [Candidatus Rhabdochlamydia sp.]